MDIGKHKTFAAGARHISIRTVDKSIAAVRGSAGKYFYARKKFINIGDEVFIEIDRAER